MPRRLTKEDAIQRMQAVRPEYGFSEFVYVNSREKSFVTCGTHGRFLSAHDNIMSGHGCPACKSAGNSALCLLPSSIAIHRMKEKAPQYGFNNFIYTGKSNKSIADCPLHGEFMTSYATILRGRGCPTCGRSSRGLKRRLDKDEAKDRMKLAMPSLDFSLFDYKTSWTKSTVICPLHGEFLKSFTHVLAGVGCKNCSSARASEQSTIPFNTFTERAQVVHGHKYTYKKETYVGVSGKVVATCRLHGDFEVRCFDHTCGQGCPSCKDTGFNPNKRAFLYIYKLLKDGVPYVGYGITASIKRRHEEHTMRCQKVGVTPILLHTFKFRLGLFCRRVESEISKEFLPVNLGARGFKKETAVWDDYPALLTRVVELHEKFKHLKSAV